jgi:hypothetical protein
MSLNKKTETQTLYIQLPQENITFIHAMQIIGSV